MKKITLACLIFAAPSYAHVPYVEGLDFQDDETFELRPPLEKSLAIYSSFNSAGDQDRVGFTLKAEDLQVGKPDQDEQGNPGRKVYFNTIVPACAPYASILPSVALIGPRQDALPEPAADISLPFTLAAEQGVYLLNNIEQGPVIQEKITGTSYFQQKTAEFFVTAPGRYEIVVWEPQGLIADYVLVVGDEEIFGPEEIAQAAKRVGYLREGKEIKDAACRQELKP